MRKETAGNVGSDGAAGGAAAASSSKKSPVFGDLPCTIENLPKFAEAAKTTDNALVQYEGVRYVRKLLSRAQDPPVNDILEAGLLPYLVEATKRMDQIKTVFEATWAITNIASTDYTHTVVDSGACPHLVNLLRSNDANIREQAAWCLGNIAGDRSNYRDMLLSSPDSINNLLLNIQTPANVSLLKNVTWCLSNFCRGKPQPKLESIAPAIPALVYLLDHDDAEVLTDAAWALSYVSDGEDSRIEACIKAGAVPKLVALLRHPNSKVVTPALRVIGNLVSGSDTLTQAVIDGGALDALTYLLSHKKKGIRKEACWAASNISAGTHDQIRCILSNREMMGKIIGHVTEAEWDVRKEAAWAFCNVATGGTEDMVAELFSLAGAWGGIVGLLTVADAKIVTLALESTEKGLRVGEDRGLKFSDAFEEGNGADLNGLDCLSNLQDHQNETIYEKAVDLMRNFFDAEDEENAAEETFAPTSNGKAFCFGDDAPAAPSAPMSFNFGGANSANSGFDGRNMQFNFGTAM